MAKATSQTKRASKPKTWKKTTQLAPTTQTGRVAKRVDKMTGQERAQITVLRPAINSGLVAGSFGPLGEIDVEEYAQCVEGEIARDDSIKATERMLLSQAHALDALFAKLAQRSALNMGEYMGAAEIYLKLAMRAQNQCRMTLETLATVKNPPVVFAKQANIAHGHQQVNNGEGAPDARAQTQNLQPEQSRITHDKGQSLDSRASTHAVGGDPALATLEEIDRAKNG